jgi:hypothetical protein
MSPFEKRRGRLWKLVENRSVVFQGAVPMMPIRAHPALGDRERQPVR